MKIFPGFGSAFFLGTLGRLTAGLSAEVKVEELDLAPAGRWMACSTSPHGIHAAAVAMKGSRYVVYVDGVEGPRIEMMLTLNGAPCSFGNNMVVGTNIMPVAFSDDGAHCAYFAKAGDEYVLYLDQKEFARGKQGLLNQAALPPTFSAGAKHLFYMEADTSAGYRLMVDGKPEPWLQNPPQLVLSMDGTRYAYVATMRGAQKPTVIFDGKDVGPIGDDPHFTADGKHLFTTIHQGQVTGLVVDGKPKLKTDGVVQLYFPTVGDGFAAVLQRLSPPGQFLFVNGHKVAGSDCQYITNDYFSPDGKRYAALCRTAGNNQYMIVDGKKGEEYASIDLPSPGPGGLWNSAGLAWADGRTQDEETASWTVATPAFTPDSSRFLYSAAVQPQHFLVIDGEESDGYMQAVDPVYGTQASTSATSAI